MFKLYADFEDVASLFFDADKDGDLDLFRGGRITPGIFPLAPRSFLLRNDNGKFTDVTPTLAPGLVKPGLVCAALFTDFDNCS